LVMAGQFLIFFHGLFLLLQSKNGQSHRPPQHIQHSTTDYVSQSEMVFKIAILPCVQVFVNISVRTSGLTAGK